MYNYKLVIAYDGTRYNGWQRQGNTENTIQGKLNEIIGRCVGEKVDIAGSGRTDKGVHAKGQVASMKVENMIDADDLCMQVNEFLPHDIRVLSITSVDERFHARLSAVEKTYRYYIDNGRIADVFSRKYAYRLSEPLNIMNMQKAADLLTGTHDYKSFCGNKNFKKSSVRTITSIKVEKTGDKVALTFTGNGFLQNMVRIMAGTLIEVGLEKRDYASMTGILQANSREAAGMTAPPEGLFLEEVLY